MKPHPSLLVFLLVIVTLVPVSAESQYMYLDSNGDGIHSSSDFLGQPGQPKTVDVYLNTNHNRDGSTAVCDTGDGDLTINMYVINLAATGGIVAFSNFINRIPDFSVMFGEVNPGNGTYKNGFGGGSPHTMPAGLYRVCTLTVTVMAGAPALNIVDDVAGSSDATEFGTQCTGHDFDNTYKLTGAFGGSDWTDVDGLTPFGCDCPPVLSAIGDMTVDEGAIATQGLTATDADGSPLFFVKGTGPPYMTVTTLNPGAGSATGQITISPGFADAAVGVPASVRVSNGVLIDTKNFSITVNNVNRAPSSNPGGPYNGVPLVPIAFDGTGSSDPDGDALTYAWQFGDLGSAVGATPSHAYAAPGSYSVSLTVTDGALPATAATTATIADVFPARAFTTRNNRLIRLGSGKPVWSAQIEPVSGSYENTDVDPSSIRMKSMGTGSVAEISPIASKGLSIDDTDGNGVAELTVPFSKGDLQALFANVRGQTTVSATFEGNLFSGGIFRAQVEIDVKGSGGGAAVAVYPNPFHPAGQVSVFTPVAGSLRIRVFNASGRLVRTLQEEASVPRGYREIPMNGADDNGNPLPSGVYFVRIDTEDGPVTTRIAIVH